jgi:serine/threonine protein kinase
MASADDDDRTVVKPVWNREATTVGPFLDSAPTPAFDPQGLPIGARVAEFEILSRLGDGGFGIVYLAWDHSLERKVALKEYLPASIAARRGDTDVSVLSERHRNTFDAGLRSFVNEGKLLAHFDHPALVKVHRFWEANGTAYMVMPFYEGITLKAHLEGLSGAPDEAWLKNLLMPLLDALQTLHAEHCYHRDIAPDNILLVGPTLKPLLLDFGAARRIIGDATQALTVILKPGYAPVEQYAEVASMHQGPWTDVYALCAVLYNAVTGGTPGPSVARLVKDDLVPATRAARGRYAAGFLAAIDHGLAVRPEDRPQDIAALRAELFGIALANERTVLQSAPVPPPRRPAQAPARRTGVWLVTVALAVALVAGVAWTVLRKPTSDAPAGALQPRALTAPPASPPPTLPTLSTLPAPVGEPAASAVATATMTANATAAATATADPFSLRGVFDDILRHADPAIAVSAAAIQPRVVIDRDRIRLRVTSHEAGYLYLFYSGTGPAAMTLVFPSDVDKANQIPANKEVLVPRQLVLNASGPAGDDFILAMVSRVPRDFSAMGLKPAQDHVAEFDLDTLRSRWPPGAQADSPYAGIARCPSGADCPQGFGASLVRITEVEASK